MTRSDPEGTSTVRTADSPSGTGAMEQFELFCRWCGSEVRWSYAICRDPSRQDCGIAHLLAAGCEDEGPF